MSEISERDRRRAVEKLRTDAKSLFHNDMIRISVSDGILVNDIAKAIGSDERDGGGATLFNDLADLIDRPACVNVHGGREFECSACGMQWHLLDRENGFEEWAHVRNPKFCPSCGAEVER